MLSRGLAGRTPDQTDELSAVPFDLGASLKLYGCIRSFSCD